MTKRSSGKKRQPPVRRHRYETASPVVLGWRPVAEAAAPTVSVGWVLLVLGVAALVGAGAWFSFSPRFYVLGAQVTGVERLSAGAVYEASGLDRLHILWANAAAAEARIAEQLPSVERVDVTCGLPAVCLIAVTERAPLLTWVVGEQVFWVDAAGGFTPAAEPLAEGWAVYGPLPTAEDGLVEPDVLAALEELGEADLARQPVTYRPGRGLVIIDEQGWRVILGQGTGMDRRLQVYALVRTYLLEQGIRPRFVDVRFPEAPYYSETNEW
ncbi:MAG: FtsQ-type POTRA domain-containing protein [Anaerolineae bacterium]|nr:FtsQ-type POTRA domain-containing protein [Anaerolineae bacterium]